MSSIMGSEHEAVIGKQYYVVAGILLLFEYLIKNIVFWLLLVANISYCLFFVFMIGENNIVERLLFFVSASVVTFLTCARIVNTLLLRTRITNG